MIYPEADGGKIVMQLKIQVKEQLMQNKICLQTLKMLI